MGALDAVTGRPDRAPGHGLEGPKHIRLFLLKLLLFVTIWGLLVFKGAWTQYAVWVASWSALISLGLLFPTPFRPARRLIVQFGTLLGRALALLALVVLYYLVLTPVALAARLSGKRFLAGKDSGQSSYWVRRAPTSPDRASMERQF